MLRCGCPSIGSWRSHPTLAQMASSATVSWYDQRDPLPTSKFS